MKLRQKPRNILCTVVDCLDMQCQKCPAWKVEGIKHYDEARKWWLQHWNFEKNEPLPQFKPGEPVLVSDDKKDWYAAEYSRFDPNEIYPYVAKSVYRHEGETHWRYCKKWPDY